MAFVISICRLILRQIENLDWQIRRLLGLTPQMTLPELKQLLVDSLDQDGIIEILGITNEELVDAFSDRIEECHDKLVRELLEEDAILSTEESDYT